MNKLPKTAPVQAVIFLKFVIISVLLLNIF